MIAIRGHFDGRVFVLDAPVDLPPDEDLLLHVHRLGRTRKRCMKAKDVAASAAVGLWRDMWPEQSSLEKSRRANERRG